MSHDSWLRMRQILMEIFQQYLYAVPCCHHLLRTCHARCVGSIHSPSELSTALHPRQIKKMKDNKSPGVDGIPPKLCGIETFCTSCDKVINETLSSDCIDGTQATNVPLKSGLHTEDRE